MALRYRIAMLAALLVLAGPVAAAPHRTTNAVKAGELVTDPPTLINLGFEWLIGGDQRETSRERS